MREMLTQGARAVFSSFTDEQWQSTIEASLRSRDQHGIRLPGFADEAMQTRTVGSASVNTLREAGTFYRFVKKACERNGSPLGASTKILDFGISRGRIIRFFLKDTDPSCLFGVDTSAEYLKAATNTECPAALTQIKPRGRLPYDDRSMDLVYAYSVFTHLPEGVQDRWLAEIKRVLKPNGMFLATVEPPRFIDLFLRADRNDPTLHPWHADMARKIQADSSMPERLRRSGFLYIPGSEVYGDTVMTPQYVRTHWGKFFEVIDVLDDPVRFWQAVVTCRAKVLDVWGRQVRRT
jgi:SAM-dependent methyltransferase